MKNSHEPRKRATARTREEIHIPALQCVELQSYIDMAWMKVKNWSTQIWESEISRFPNSQRSRFAGSHHKKSRSTARMTSQTPGVSLFVLFYSMYHDLIAWMCAGGFPDAL